MRITSTNGFEHCPYCGKEVNREEKPLETVTAGPDGEDQATRANLEVSCPDHGVLYL